MKKKSAKVKSIKKKRSIKICLVCSAGGHFYELQQLRDWWSKYNHFWVTLKRRDTEELLKNEKVYFGYFPENRNIINAIKHCFLALQIFIKEKPDIIFSNGAGIAPPFFLIGKILGVKLVYLEPSFYINIPTLTGKLVYNLTDVFLVQHKNAKRFFPKAEYHGGLI